MQPPVISRVLLYEILKYLKSLLPVNLPKLILIITSCRNSTPLKDGVLARICLKITTIVIHVYLSVRNWLLNKDGLIGVSLSPYATPRCRMSLQFYPPWYHLCQCLPLYSRQGSRPDAISCEAQATSG